VVFPLLNQLTATKATVENAMLMVLASWMLAFLFLKGPQIAAGILAGMPSLSAGQVLQAAAGTAVAGAAAVTLGGTAAGLGARALLGTGGTLVRGAAATSTAYQIGSATTVGGSLAQIGGGLRGVATAGVRALGSGTQSVGSASVARLRQTLQHGRQAGWVATGGRLPPRPTPSLPTRDPTVSAAFRDALTKTARYFGHDQPHGGVRADLD
jgi:type IV secretion system protein TrbL